MYSYLLNFTQKENNCLQLNKTADVNTYVCNMIYQEKLVRTNKARSLLRTALNFSVTS